MANNFQDTALVTKIALKEFRNQLQLGAKVNRTLDKEFRKVGDNIKVPRPIMFTSASGATLGTAVDIEERSATVTLNDRRHVHFAITSQDMTLSIEDMTNKIIRPAMYELAQYVETSIAAIYTTIGNFVGTAGTSPSTFLNVGDAAAVLQKLGVPEDVEWSAFFDPNASLALANGLKGVFPTTIATKAIEKASIGQYAGFDMFRNNSLAVHTVGVNTGTPLVNGASQDTTYTLAGDAWTQSLITDGWTNSTADILLAGDVFTIAGVNSVNRRTRTTTGDLQTFSVTADAASGASTGPSTLTITPPIITSGPYQTVDAAPADDAVITVLTGVGASQHRQNLAFHKNAITLAMAPLDLVTDGATSARESFDNISIRSTRQYAIGTDITTFRFDILFGVKAQNPDFAIRITS